MSPEEHGAQESQGTPFVWSRYWISGRNFRAVCCFVFSASKLIVDEFPSGRMLSRILEGVGK